MGGHLEKSARSCRVRCGEQLFLNLSVDISFLGTYQICGKRENMSAAFLYADDQVTGNGAGL